MYHLEHFFHKRLILFTLFECLSKVGADFFIEFEISHKACLQIFPFLLGSQDGNYLIIQIFGGLSSYFLAWLT